jgi:hypothetical protein
MSELLVKLDMSRSEIREMLMQVYGNNVKKKTAIYKWRLVSLREENVPLMKRAQDDQQRAELKKTLQKFVKLCVKIVG